MADILQRTFLDKILLKYVREVVIDSRLSLVQVMNIAMQSVIL